MKGVLMSRESKKRKLGKAKEIEPGDLKAICKELAEKGFDHVKSLTGIDRPEDGQIELVYHVSSYSSSDLQGEIAEIRTKIDRDDPRIGSLAELWPSAEYMEAETRDLLGVIFEGNELGDPLLLPEELKDEYPLRKDFVIPEEGIK